MDSSINCIIIKCLNIKKKNKIMQIINIFVPSILYAVNYVLEKKSFVNFRNSN